LLQQARQLRLFGQQLYCYVRFVTLTVPKCSNVPAILENFQLRKPNVAIDTEANAKDFLSQPGFLLIIKGCLIPVFCPLDAF
jgi:hypothetical protein